MTWQLLIKFPLVILLIGYILYDILLFYVLPINKGFDDATNHLLSLYQTTAVFFAAIAAYFFFNKPFRSPIGILTRAECEENAFHLRDNARWADMTSDERDVLMAGEILKILTVLKPPEQQNNNNILARMKTIEDKITQIRDKPA